ncbi:DEKNAAC101094, partial [Brettanomyces naardenensis]
MKQLRRCFISLRSDELEEPITLVFKLFSRTLPVAVAHFLELCRGEFDKCSYKLSEVTRVVAPEYIVQMGKIVKRSESTLSRIGDMIDSGEYDKMAVKVREKLKFKKGGLLCLVDGENSRFEFFVTLDDLRKYKDKELSGYLIIGELENPEIARVNEWLEKLQVDDDDRPVSRCWIDRCGELVAKKSPEEADKSSAVPTTTTTTTTAYDLLFK